MAAREAVYITATALSTNLQTKLAALSIESGEAVPTIGDFRDIFSDDEPGGLEGFTVLVALDEVGEDDGEFESFSKYDINIPLLCSYVTTDRDTAASRATASYVLRGMIQVLNDVTRGQTRNSVTFIQYLRPRFTIGPDSKGNVGLELRFVAHMRDEAP